MFNEMALIECCRSGTLGAFAPMSSWMAPIAAKQTARVTVNGAFIGTEGDNGAKLGAHQ
jgi:hypothetical protein